VALGTVIAADGYILTKASELKYNDVKTALTCKLPDGREVPARVVGVHDETDLAMLWVGEQGLTPVEWRTGPAPAVGEWVATSGVAGDPAAIGVVSVAPRRVFSPRGLLGIGLETVPDGPRIREVTPGSGAAKAGLAVGDIVRSVDGKPVKTHDELIALVARYNPGDTLNLVVLRDGKEHAIKATLGTRPNAGRSVAQNALGGALSERRSNFPQVLQHDSVLQPADCGGPLVDLSGKAVGINIARAGRVESYALPAELVLSLAGDLRSGRLAPPSPYALYEKQLAAALTSLRSAEASVQATKSDLDKLLSQAQAALKNVEAARAAAEKAVKDAQQALEQARAASQPPPSPPAR
jgi:serine protease Do